VVKVGAGGAFGRPQLVVEVVLRRDGPLAGHGRAVREGRGSLSEAMPVLFVDFQSILSVKKGVI
jgi:hypothetical protein